MYQPLPPSADPVPPNNNKYRPILTQYHHLSTSTAFYWPSTTKYQQLPPYTDPVPPSINLYCCCMGITDFCTVYPGSCFVKYSENLNKKFVIISYLSQPSSHHDWSKGCKRMFRGTHITASEVGRHLKRWSLRFEAEYTADSSLGGG